MRVVRELITPDRASELLMRNTANRYIREPLVNQYATDMANGAWKSETGETIKINKSGGLSDGQHRLRAVIKSGVSSYLYIAYDVDDDAFDVIDSGLKRQAKDTLHVMGVQSSALLAAIITKYHTLSNGVSYRGSQGRGVTSATVRNVYDKNSDMWAQVASKAMTWYSSFNRVLTPSTIGGYYRFLADISEADAEEFFSQLCERGYPDNLVIALLKEKLLQDKISNRKMGQAHKHALIIKTWNMYRKGKTVKLLKFAIDEEMPTAI